MKKTRKWLLLGLVCYACFMVYLMPAAFVLRYLDLPPGLDMQGVQGSIWSGTARQVHFRTVVLDLLAWHIQPTKFFQGEWGYLISGKLQEHPASGYVSVSTNKTVQIQNLQLPLLLSEHFKTVNFFPTGLQGSVHIALDQLTLEDGKLRDFQADISLQNVRLPGYSLGDYVGKFHYDGKIIQGECKDQQGPLQLEAMLRLSSDGRLNVQGTLLSREPNNQVLADVINTIGRQRADGRHVFTLNHRLPLVF